MRCMRSGNRLPSDQSCRENARLPTEVHRCVRVSGGRYRSGHWLPMVGQYHHQVLKPPEPVVPPQQGPLRRHSSFLPVAAILLWPPSIFGVLSARARDPMDRAPIRLLRHQPALPLGLSSMSVRFQINVLDSTSADAAARPRPGSALRGPTPFFAGRRHNPRHQSTISTRRFPAGTRTPPRAAFRDEEPRCPQTSSIAASIRASVDCEAFASNTTRVCVALSPSRVNPRSLTVGGNRL